MKKIITILQILIISLVSINYPVFATEKEINDYNETSQNYYDDFFSGSDSYILLDGEDVTSVHFEKLKSYYEEHNFDKIDNFLKDGYVLQIVTDSPSTRAVEQRVRTIREKDLNKVNNYDGEVWCNWEVNIQCVYNVDANTGRVTWANNPRLTLVLAEISNVIMATGVLHNQSSYVQQINNNSVTFGYGFTIAANTPLYENCKLMTFKTVNKLVTF